MWRKYYARWMYRWETALTTRDSNRIVRPVEWGFEWLLDFSQRHGFDSTRLDPTDHDACERAMLELNELIIRQSGDFFAYRRPADFVLEERHPQLFPTNVRPETLQKEAKLRQRAVEGKL